MKNQDPDTPDEEYEKIDGLRIALSILNNLSTDHRERLLTRIQSIDPEMFQRLKRDIFTFDEIANLTDQSIQLLIRNISHRDLILSLKSCDDAMRLKFFNNMSEKMLQIMQDDFDNLQESSPQAIEDAKERILVVVDQMRSGGALRIEVN